MSDFTHEFFEESSKAWKANKIRLAEATYKYKTKAFPPEPSLPLPFQQTQASKKTSAKELKQRQSIDEPAPLRVRRSPRLLEEHRKETYA